MRAAPFLLLVLLLAPYAPATALDLPPGDAALPQADAPAPHGDVVPPVKGVVLPFTPPPVLDQWVAIPVLQTRPDGTDVPAFLAINVAMRGTTKEAMKDAGIPFIPLLDAPGTPREKIRETAIPAETAEALVGSLRTAGSGAGTSITDADPVRAHLYYDQALLDQGFANEATAAWAVSVDVIARDTGINIWDAYVTSGRVNGVPDDVTSPCHMQSVAFWVEQTFPAGSRGDMINIFSPGDVSVDGGSQGYTNDGPLTVPLRWGESVEDCTGTMAPKRSPAYIPQTYIRVDDMTYMHIVGYHDGDLKGTDYLVAHEVAHVFGMEHGHAACYTTSGQLWHLHKTLEAYTAGAGTPPECEQNWFPAHYHWSFSAAGINAMKAERTRWTGCVNAGWCTWGATPAAPTVTVTPGDGQVQLTVSTAPANGGSSIYEYKVFRGTTSYFMSDSPLTQVIPGPTGTLVDTGLVNGQTYYYYVRAVNSVGWGPRSGFYAATPATLAPAAPTLQWADGSFRFMDVAWTPNSPGSAPITGYKLYRGTCSGCETLLVAGVPTTSYHDPDVVPGVTYYYKVAAMNAVGTGPLSNEQSGASYAIAPYNDHISNAFIGAGTSWSPSPQHTGSSSTQTGEQFPCSMGASTVWYRFTPSSAATYRFSTANSDYNTVLAVYNSGTLGAASLGCNNDFGGVQSQLDLSLSGGVSYWVQVGSASGTTPGTLQLSIVRVSGGSAYVRYDDGTRSGALEMDYNDDEAAKYLRVRDADHAGATSARLWVLAQAKNCGATGGTHTLSLNGNDVATFDPCAKWSSTAYSWTSFTVPVSSLAHSSTGSVNAFSIRDSAASWTDQAAYYGVASRDEFERSYVSPNNSGDIPSELMWYLELVK